jgi:hypothetical protein
MNWSPIVKNDHLLKIKVYFLKNLLTAENPLFAANYH